MPRAELMLTTATRRERMMMVKVLRLVATNNDQ
jgi:hypothetical protein